jgi:hypothetical protein
MRVVLADHLPKCDLVTLCASRDLKLACGVLQLSYFWSDNTAPGYPDYLSSWLLC